VNVTEVVAALIWQDGKFMICQRPAHKARGLLWEFVGGKVEPGETKEEALIRECREELDITVSVGDIFTQVVHEYPDILIRLTLFHCTIAQGTPSLLEHHDLKWILPEEIPSFDFCPADKDILALIRKTYM
jgi:8-oxo-dGTP diphosphatase